MYPSTVIFGMTLYDICLVIAVVLVLFMADRMGIIRGFSVRLQKTLIIAIMGAIVVGFFGAVLFQAVYNAIKTGEFVINSSTGMTFYGGLIFGILGFLAVWFGVGRVMCKNDEAVQKFGAVADIAACLIPLAHGIGRIGCFTAGCCHGAHTDAWYGTLQYIHGLGKEPVKVVPIQLFEALFLFVLSGVMFWLFFKKFGKENKGRFPLLPIYIVVYGLWRFFIEFARADDRGATVVAFLSPSQLVAVCMILVGVGYFLLWYFMRKKETMVEANPEMDKPKPENEG